MNSALIAILALVASSFRTRFPTGRDSRPSPSIGCSSGHCAAPFAPQAFRPRAMGFAVTMVSGLAPMSANRSTCNRDRLAPQSLGLVLDAKITTPAGETASNRRDSSFDPANAPGEPIVGSTAYSWGTAQVRNRDSRIHGWQISAAYPQAAFADVASVPE